MISVTPGARELILAKATPVRLELARVVHGGCGVPPIEERPAVRFGAPPADERDAYQAVAVDGITVYVPRALPDGRALTIGVTSLLGFRRLVVERWNPLGWELSAGDDARR